MKTFNAPTAINIEQRAAAELDLVEQRRGEIVEHIYARLGKDLAEVYRDQVPQSVGTGCYDFGWANDDASKIEQYVAGLRRIWLDKQGDQSHVLAAVMRVLAFGSADEKAELKRLLQLED